MSQFTPLRAGRAIPRQLFPPALAGIQAWWMVWLLSLTGKTVAISHSCLAFASIADDPTDKTALELISGSVVDPAGRGLSGVHVVARRHDTRHDFAEYLYHGEKYTELDRNFADGQSDLQGDFQLPLAGNSGYFPLVVIAHRAGFAPSISSWDGQPCRLRLQPGVTIRGSVINQENQPIAAAQVRLMSWYTYEQNQAALARNHSELGLEGHLFGDRIRIETRTNAEGTFRLEDLPNDRWVVLAIAAAGFLPQCVVLDTGNDPALESAATTKRLFDQGVVRLKPATQVELRAMAQDTGKPVRLKAAYTSNKRWLQTTDPVVERAKSLEVQGHRVTLPFLPPGEQRVWLVPDPSTGYLAAQIDLPGDDESTLREQEVEVIPGAPVVGRVVDDVTNAPVAGATIHYEPESWAEVEQRDASVPAVVSDQNGEFAVNVPAMRGWLRQIGRVDGYRTVSFAPHQEARRLAPATKIVPVSGQETRVEIRLQPATRVSGQVVDINGRPVPYARFSAVEHLQSGFRDIWGTSDEQGRFELDNIFAEILVETQTDAGPLPTASTARRIFFWSPDRQNAATLQVPIPAVYQPDYHLKVVLTPASSITGRLVDWQTGVGVSDVTVSFRYLPGPSSSMFATFAAQSDPQGYFVLKPIFADANVALLLQGDYVGQQRSQENWLNVNAETQHDLGEIPLFVYRDLEALLELPELANLTPQEAFQKLQLALAKIRERIAEVQRWQGGRSSTDSISAAEMMAAERFGEAFLKLSQRTSDRELAFSILSGLLTNLDTAWAPSFYASRAKQALLEQFLERENLHETLPKILPSHDTKHWQYVYDHAKNQQVKALACGYLVENLIGILPMLADFEGISDERFTEDLAVAQQLWRYALQETSAGPGPGEFLKPRTEQHLKMLLNQVESSPNSLNRRREQLKQAIQKHLPNQTP